MRNPGPAPRTPRNLRPERSFSGISGALAILAGALLLPPPPGTAQDSAHGTRVRAWKEIRFAEVGAAFRIPADFETRPALTRNAGQTAREYTGMLGGTQALLRIRTDADHFQTVSRGLLEVAQEGRLLSVRGFRLDGEPGARYRLLSEDHGLETLGVLLCPRRRLVHLALQLPRNAGAAPLSESSRLLESLRILPAKEITLARPMAELRDLSELRLGFPGRVRADIRELSTAHYRLWTDAAPSGARKLLAFLEREFTPLIQERIGPFDRDLGHPDLTIFLHRTRNGYLLAALRSGIPREQAEAMDGHAWDRFYSTWYAGPRDPIHIHEATHQVMAAVYGLDGGGPWLQEGIAQWVESRFSRLDPRRLARNLLRRSRAPDFDEMLRAKSFLHRNRRGLVGSKDLYELASSLLAFLREKRPEAFPDFLLETGILPDTRKKLCEEAIEHSLGWDMDELEARWKAWALDRK